MTDKIKLPPELIKWELWRRGQLRWKLYKHQQSIYDSYWGAINNTECLLFASNVSRRFGKSFIGAVVAFEYALRFPGSNVKYACPTQNQMHKVLEEVIPPILADCPDDCRPQKKGGKFIFPNGSTIQIAGSDMGNADRLRGTSSHLSIVDEAGFVANLKYLITSVLMPTQIKVGGTMIIQSTPAEAVDHHFTKVCMDAKTKGNYLTKNINDDPTVTPSIRATYAEQYGGEQTTEFKREFLCEFVTEWDLVITPDWKTETMVSDPQRDDFYNYYHKYVSLDIGVRDNTAALFGYYNHHDEMLCIQDEYTISGPTMTTDVLAEAIKGKEAELWGKCKNSNTYDNDKVYRRVGDTNNLLLLQDLTTLHGIPFAPTGKGALTRMVNDLRLLIRKDKLRVHPRCKMTIGCLETGYWNDTHTGFAHSQTYSHFDHLAALIYLVRNVDTHTNPIPTNYGISGADHVIISRPETRQDLENLGRAFRRR